MPRNRRSYDDMLKEVRDFIATSGGEVTHNALMESVPSDTAQAVIRMAQSRHIIAEVKATATAGQRAILTYRVGGE